MQTRPHQPAAPTAATRRTFLKASVMAVSAAAASRLVVPQFVHAAGSGDIRIGMIGCGGRCSGAAAQALSLGPDVKLVAMTDVFQKRMEEKRAYFQANAPTQFAATDDTCKFGLDGYKTVIEASDAVLIACASKYHSFYAEEAVKAGKHVFVEKPHAIDAAGCVRMRRACELAKKKGVSVVSGHESRYDVGYQEQVKRIHDGAIGDVVAIQSMFLRAPYATVVRAPGLTEMQYQFSNWYHFRWLSGDDVTQSLVHNLDRMRWVLHEKNPTSCFSLAGRSTSFGEVYGDMFDHHAVVYEFGGGPRLYALCQTRANCYPLWDDIIMGSEGTCYWSDCRIEGANPWRFAGQRNDANVEEQKILIGSIREGRLVNHGDTMVDSTYMAIMGQVASYTGQPVTWEQITQSEFEFEPKLADVRLDGEAPTHPDADGNYPLPIPGLQKIL
jgi:myo-inositol 2-dehydrogenase / D-chiro-inositol 1-dehydrogenase